MRLCLIWQIAPEAVASIIDEFERHADAYDGAIEQPDQPFVYLLRDGSRSAVAPIGKRGSGGKAPYLPYISPISRP